MGEYHGVLLGSGRHLMAGAGRRGLEQEEATGSPDGRTGQLCVLCYTRRRIVHGFS